MDSVKYRLSPIPGWLLMVATALFSSFLSQRITIGMRHPLESVTIAILVGLLLKNLLSFTSLLRESIISY